MQFIFALKIFCIIFLTSENFKVSGVVKNKSKDIPKWKKQACEIPPNQYSHYKCDENGDLKCLPGWQGDLCDVPICRRNCDPLQGYCKRPNECRCKLGYYGENCEKCIPLPGCQYGFCRVPFECSCRSGYEGIFCQEPICKKDCHPSHGYCERAGECRCRIGWSGPLCRDCQVLPGCRHGFCSQPLECRCLPGWTGVFCDQAICDAKCSRRTGYCKKPGECRCKVGWMGANCTECHAYPGCVNGDCNKPWECNCKKGWGGILCDEELNYCEKNPNTCENGGLCTSLLKEDGYFKCECSSGYKGDRCDRMTMTSITQTSTTNVPPVTQSTIKIIPVTSFAEEVPLLREKTTTTTTMKVLEFSDDENET